MKSREGRKSKEGRKDKEEEMKSGEEGRSDFPTKILYVTPNRHAELARAMLISCCNKQPPKSQPLNTIKIHVCSCE